MDATQQLKSLLQVQLASDGNAVLHLPYILSSLTVEHLQPSQHTQKWTTRINSLLQSKDAGARWAGCCIAFKTASLSKDIMIESAQSWVTTSLPLLSKNEPLPTLKAVIRLLRLIFTNALDVPEFQRQICTPNVPKFTASLLVLGEKYQDIELRVLIMETCTHLVEAFPTLHRAMHGGLSSLSLSHLNGAAPQPVHPDLVKAAAALYSTLHHTGGKVGAAAQWRKSLDDTIAFAWGALHCLRTTFPSPDPTSNTRPSPEGDPVVAVPLYIDRLRAAIHVLYELLQTSVSRPVVVPIGTLVRLCVALLRCSNEAQLEGHVDPIVHSLEVSITPYINELGCTLLDGLVGCAQQYLSPHYSQLLFYVTHHLEQKYTSSHRLPFVMSAANLLKYSRIAHDSVLMSRLARSVLPYITILLPTQTSVQQETANNSSNASLQGRKGKKRARGYEGDEVFKMTKGAICSTPDDGNVILAALEVIQHLLESGQLSPAVQSVASRVIISIQLSLPQISPSLLSLDESLYPKVKNLGARICRKIASGTTGTASKAIGLVIGSSLHSADIQDLFSDLELLVHPRMPPLIRSLPQVESLSLFQRDESQEEIDARKALQLGTMDDIVPTNGTTHRDQVSQDQQQPVAPSVTMPTHPQSLNSRNHFTQPQSIRSEPSWTPPIPVPSSTVSHQFMPANEENGRPFPATPNVATKNIAPVSNPVVTTQVPSAVTPTLSGPSSSAVVGSAVDDDDDEPMPSIDMGSDSDSD
ncbi:Pre-rRNA-processing protein RIX1 [Abortiporus biennis]